MFKYIWQCNMYLGLFIVYTHKFNFKNYTKNRQLLNVKNKKMFSTLKK